MKDKVVHASKINLTVESTDTSSDSTNSILPTFVVDHIKILIMEWKDRVTMTPREYESYIKSRDTLAPFTLPPIK